MKIVIVEDDYLQAEGVREALDAAFPGAKIDRIATELEFSDRLDELRGEIPDVVVMDVMLRWTDPEPEMRYPPDAIRRAGPSRPGFRCRKLLQQHERTRNIPVILYTVLSRDDLDRDLKMLGSDAVEFVAKDSDFTELIQRIRELLPTPAPAP